jgi:hypothetical protein
MTGKESMPMPKEVNLAYLHDILAYMIEAQYERNLRPEDYVKFVDHYRAITHVQRRGKERERFEEGLKDVLKYLLNNSQLDYDEVFLESAFHALPTQEDAARVLEILWSRFFDDEEWRDAEFDEADVMVHDEPIS